MRKSTLIAAALSLVAGAASAKSATDHAVDEAVITLIKTETWPDFYRKQDADGLSSFLDEAFVNIAPDGSVTPRNEELQGVREFPWNPVNFSYTVEKIVWLKDDLVIIVGRGASDRTNDEGEPCRHSYTSSNLLERAADAPLGWRALSSHVSGVGCVAS